MPQINTIATELDTPRQQIPASVKARLLAEGLIQQQASSTSTPIYHAGAGIAKMGAGLVGGIMEGAELRRMEEAQAQARGDEFAMLNAVMQARARSMNPAPNPSPASPPQPAPAPAAASKPQPNTAAGGDHAAFINSIMPQALAVSQRTGIDPRVIVAQAAHESGWGKSAPGNNLFGIKGPGTGPIATTESINGQTVPTMASFRSFDSPGASVEGYGTLMMGPRYAGVRGAKGLDAQIDALGKSGYATDPDYAAKVGSIARSLPMPSGPAPDVATTSASPAPLAGGMGHDDLSSPSPIQPASVDIISGVDEPGPYGAPASAPSGAATGGMSSAQRAAMVAALSQQGGGLPSGPAADALLAPATMKSNPPPAAGGGLGASPVGFDPAMLAAGPSPNDIQTLPGAMPPNPIPNAQPDAGPGLPQTGPMPPPRPGFELLGDRLNEMGPQGGDAPPADTAAMAPQSAPMADAPAQKAISGAMGGGSTPQQLAAAMADPTNGTGVASGHSPMSDPSSPLNFNLQQARGPMLAQAMAGQGQASPAPQQPPPQRLAAGMGSEPAAAPSSDAPPQAKPDDLGTLMRRVAMNPYANPNLVGQMAQMMMPDYHSEKNPDGTVTLWDSRNGTSRTIGTPNAGATTVAPSATYVGPGGPGRSPVTFQAPGAPVDMGPDHTLVNPNQPNAPIARTPPTPDFKPVEGTTQAQDARSGATVPLPPGGGGYTTSLKVNGVDVPIRVTPDPSGGQPKVEMLTPPAQGGPQGGGPLGAVQPLVKQANDMAAQGEATKKEAGVQVEDLGKVATAGQEARQKLAQLDQLEKLTGKFGTGLATKAAAWLNDHGISNQSGSDQEAFRGLAGQLATGMRPAGSGPLRVAEMDRFQAALGNENMTPADRLAAINRYRSVLQRDAVMGDIAANGQMDPQTRMDRLHQMAAQPYGGDAAPAGTGQPVKITGAADYSALPSGAQFIDPTGVLRTKR